MAHTITLGCGDRPHAAGVARRVPNVRVVDLGSEADALWLKSTEDVSLYAFGKSPRGGTHLLLEMHWEMAEDDLLAIRDACDAGAARCTIGQAMRFSPSSACVKQQLDAGRLGDPCLLRIHRWQPRQGGDAALLDALVCHIDLACWLFAASPDHVYARGQPDDSPAHECDYVQIHLGFPSGAMALIDNCRSLPEGDSYASLSLIGASGAAYADDHHNMQLLYGGGSPQARNTFSPALAEALQLQAFIAAIEEERPPPITVEDALRVARIVAAVQASLRERRAIAV